MAQTVFGIVMLVMFLTIGSVLILNPRSQLAKFGRPATDKHIRATRMIGMVFVVVVLLTLVRWFLSMNWGPRAASITVHPPPLPGFRNATTTIGNARSELG